MLTNPRYQIAEFGNTSLIGTNEQVDQNDYGKSTFVTLGDGVRPVSGEILSFLFISSKTGTGAIQTPDGVLLLLDTDPAVAAGDTSITAGERGTILGQVPVDADNWIADANGASVCVLDKPIPFHNLQKLYVVWFHTDATSFNDGAGDDEYLAFNAWYRRDT